MDSRCRKIQMEGNLEERVTLKTLIVIVSITHSEINHALDDGFLVVVN